MRTNKDKMKPVIYNCDGNLYYFESVTAACEYLGISRPFANKWLKDPDNYGKFKNFRVKLEWYDDNIHTCF